MKHAEVRLAAKTAVFALAASITTAAHAATLPYTNNFDGATIGTTLPADFTETNVGTANSAIAAAPGAGGLSGNVLTQTASATVGGTTASNTVAAVNLTNASGSDFSISTNFTISALDIGTTTGSTVNTALVAVGSAADFSTSSVSSYRAFYTLTAPTGTGTLNIQEFGNSTGGFGNEVGGTLIGTNRIQSTATNAVTLDTKYTLTLTGTYTGGGTGIQLSASLTGGDGTTIIISVTDSTPRTGTFFGYRTALATSGGTGTVTETLNFDNLNVVVPEPGSAALLMLGAAGFAAFAARRQRRA